MTERLSDITARIQGIRELGSVVNAMRGIAGARAQQARSALQAVELYSGSLSAAIGQALGFLPPEAATPGAKGRILILFAGEQGFAGAFNERMFDAARSHLDGVDLFLIGTRGEILAAERGIVVAWKAPMPAHPDSIPKLANHIATELYRRIASGRIGGAEVLYARSATSAQSAHLFPLDPKRFKDPRRGNEPLLNLSPDVLLAELTEDYIYAQLCDAALHAFAAENEARTEAMAAAHREIGRQLAGLESRQRIVRQDEITAEIIELASGEAASQSR